MDCTEMNFEHLVSITAYPEGAVSFALPFRILKKYIRNTELSVDESQGFSLRFESGKFKATESIDHTVNGYYYVDKFSWEIKRPKEIDIDYINKITGNPHHLKFTFFGGSVMWLRAHEEGWTGGYMHDSDSCRIELSAMTISGLQLLRT